MKAKVVEKKWAAAAAAAADVGSSKSKSFKAMLRFTFRLFSLLSTRVQGSGNSRGFSFSLAAGMADPINVVCL